MVSTGGSTLQRLARRSQSLLVVRSTTERFVFGNLNLAFLVLRSRIDLKFSYRSSIASALEEEAS